MQFLFTLIGFCSPCSNMILSISICKFETHPLYNKKDGHLKLRIYDCRGLHDIKGVTAEDIRLIVDGHIKHGYTVNVLAIIFMPFACL